MPKKSKQKFKYLENEKSFQDEIKGIFIIFEGLSLKQIIKRFLEGDSPTLIDISSIYIQQTIFLSTCISFLCNTKHIKSTRNSFLSVTQLIMLPQHGFLRAT